MYRILLVDDEWLERDTLEKYMPWEEMGFQVAAAAENGKEALLLLSRWEEEGKNGESGVPDVLLTDVKMPLMDGVALSREVHSRWPDMQIVFLSGYHEFEYVRAALNVEACGYILKPLELSELKKTMEKVREKCSRASKKHRTQAAFTAEKIRELLGVFSEAHEEVWEEVRRSLNGILHCPENNASFFIGLITVDEYRFLSGYEEDGSRILNTLHEEIRSFTGKNRILPFPVNDYSWLLISDRRMKEEAELFWNLKSDVARWTTICLYLEKQPLERLPGLHTTMDRYRKWNVRLYGSGHVIVCDTFSPKSEALKPECRPDFADLAEYLQKGKREDVKRWAAAYCRENAEYGGTLSKAALELADQVYASVITPNRQLAERFEERPGLYGKLAAVESPQLIEELLERFLFEVMDALTGLAGDRRMEIVRLVTAIIEKEYASPLTIEYLAGKVYMSPNYLRTLFKDYTGETVLEYMTKIRLRESAALLAKTNLRVHEISRRVGYENPSYYCAVFRKQMGVTPNRYRSQIAEGKTV